MYTAYIGKRLIELVNQREGKNYTAKAFFEEKYAPIFFKNERYLQWVNNSPFDQAYKQSTPEKPTAKKPKKVVPITKEVLNKALQELHKKVENDLPDDSFFLGGASSKASSLTSGQVTDLILPITPQEVYASWIGAALGIGVGELNILIDFDEVIWVIYEGWAKYRDYMDQTPNLKPLQINTWNGFWIINAFDNYFDADHPFSNKSPNIKTDAKTGIASIKPSSWVQVIFALASKFPLICLNSYVYILSERGNVTVGFIIIDLPKVSYLGELYEHVVKEQSILKTDALENLYDTELGFQRACELGKIGIPALEPSHLREYMFKGRNFKPPQNSNELNTYILYQTWIIAMLDNQKLLELAQNSALVLLNFANQKDRGTTTNRRLVDALFEANYLRQFIERLEELIKKNPSEVGVFEELFNSVSIIPTSNFPMFKALLRIKYAIAQAKQLNQSSNENN